MPLFSKIKGIIGNIFTLGIGSDAHALADHTDGVAVTDNSGMVGANIVIARPHGASQDIHGATYLDVKERVVDIEFAFDGDTYTPGSNEGKYGICHTSGGSCTAGAIYLEVSAALTPIPMYKMMMACSRMTFSGTVGMVEDGIYLSESASAPYGWTLKGDAGPSGTGQVKTISLPFSYADIGSPVSSSATVPAGAKVYKSTVRVSTAFTGGAAPTCLVEIHGTSVDTTIQDTSDNNLAMPTPPNYFDNSDVLDIPPGEGGPVRVTLGGTAAFGVGEVEVMYALPLN
jgi:hypothetical protein